MVALGATLLLARTTDRLGYDHELFPRSWDHHKYIEIAASSLGSFHIAPYCWRIGAPLVARWLPGDIQSGFTLLSWLSTWLIGILLYLLARRVGFSLPLALTGLLLLYTLEWAPKLYLFNVWLPDAPAALLTTAALWAIVTRRDWLFVVLLVAGVAVKESVLFVAPLAYSLRATRLWEPQLALRSLLLTLPAVLALVTIRLAIPAWNDDPAYVAALPERLWLVHHGSADYGYVESFRDYSLRRIRDPAWGDLLIYTVRPFGIGVSLVAALGAVLHRERLLRFAPFILLVYSQPFFAGDNERLLVAAFPAVLLLALDGLDGLLRRAAAPRSLALALPLSIIAAELWHDTWFFLPLRLQLLATIAGLAAPVVLWHGARRLSDTWRSASAEGTHPRSG